jgi:hypothetical protein
MHAKISRIRIRCIAYSTLMAGCSLSFSLARVFIADVANGMNILAALSPYSRAKYKKLRAAVKEAKHSIHEVCRPLVWVRRQLVYQVLCFGFLSNFVDFIKNAIAMRPTDTGITTAAKTG